MNRSAIMDAINRAYVELEDNPGDLKAITRLSQNVWSLQYSDSDDRVFAMFLTLWCNDVVQNFSNHAQDCMDEDREMFGSEIGNTLKEIFILDYAIPAGSKPEAARSAYGNAMRLLTNVYVEAIVRSNARAACYF